MFSRTLVFLLILPALPVLADDPWVVYEGKEGPGKGKHIVLVSGDEEYRSEETLPQLAAILARHHGFKCTVLFAIDKKDGTINPNVNNHIPGLEKLKEADLAIFFLRFRNLPDEQMQYIADYVDSGKPIIGLRTSTHAFSISGKSKFADWSWNRPDGGFGRRVLGETWVAHHGAHGRESTRGVIAADAKNHPVVRGIQDGDIWGPTDVYTVKLPLPGDSKPLVLGQVLRGMKPTDPPVEGKKNDPMMPIAWVKTHTTSSGQKARVFTATIASSQDLQSEGVRRLYVNACYWALGLEDRLPEKAKVDLVGTFQPRPFSFNGYQKGLKPADLRWKD
jgi:hypothetical protein